MLLKHQQANKELEE